MPTSLLTEASAPAPILRRALHVAGIVLLVVACLGAMGILLRALSGPEFVDELTVSNPTDFAVHVRVSDDGDSWLGLGMVKSGEEHTFGVVIDQGKHWIFEFGYAGAVAGHLDVRRDALSESGWRVEVPTGVGAHLAERGFTPPPPGGS